VALAFLAVVPVPAFLAVRAAAASFLHLTCGALANLLLCAFLDLFLSRFLFLIMSPIDKFEKANFQINFLVAKGIKQLYK
jgi:hypothetical protein